MGNKILINAPSNLKDQLDAFVSENPGIDAKIFTTDSFDGAQMLHMLLEYGPEVLTSVSVFIASLRAENIEININLPSLGEDSEE